ncbi:general odorant-binding protein 69a-like isoform X2 [Haematobia irritans]|uniref:general odorant-binding protein 69a-like isoform X2 n=1 Tax=Haematobia irritans TaxID=7368 RepID=UPI003F50A371
MKLLILPEYLQKMAKKINKKCLQQTNAPNDLFKPQYRKMLPRDSKYACYWSCVLKILGIMDGNNFMRLEVLLDIVPEDFHEMIQVLANSCGTQNGADHCEIALNTMQCYVNNKPDLLVKELSYVFD